MTLTRDQMTKLAYAADVWRYPKHEITLACGNCDAEVATGTIDLTPNWEPFVGWDQVDAMDGAVVLGVDDVTFRCQHCSASWRATFVDQLRAALLALDSPTFEHELRLHTRRVRLTLGVEFPRPEAETIAFIESLPPAPLHPS